jgi:hypothetical protein
LRGIQAPNSASADEIARVLAEKDVRFVSKSDLSLLAKAEEREAQARGVEYFKFSEDEMMLAAIELEKAGSAQASNSHLTIAN